ncbi:MAG: hypothetical protein AB7G23_03095 [Vicinamibacterales bacterium]
MTRFVTGLLVGLALTVAAAQDAPRLDALEQAHVEILRLQVALATAQRDLDVCRIEAGRFRASLNSRDLTEAEATLQLFIERRHPGFSWNPKTQAFTPIPEASDGP